MQQACFQNLLCRVDTLLDFAARALSLRRSECPNILLCRLQKIVDVKFPVTISTRNESITYKDNVLRALLAFLCYETNRFSG
jgi:hypothetical protein